MNIKKIALTNSGFKGMQVEYTEPNLRDGKEGKKITKDKLDHPIHLGLERPFKDLRFHMLEICNIIHSGMDKKEIDFAVAEAEVTGIKVDGDEFSILGNKEIFEGKSFKIETPMVAEEDCYEHYPSVAALITKIIEETKLYLRGEVKVSDDELVERWVNAGKDKDHDTEAYNNMTIEEKIEYHRDILENKFGLVVLGANDYSVEFSDEKEEDFKQEIDQNQDTIVIEMQPEPVKLPR